MSCVSALIHESSIYMACDSYYTSEGSVWHSKYPKWFKPNDRVCIAVCGETCALQLFKVIPFNDMAPTIETVESWCAGAKTIFKDLGYNFDVLICGNGKIFSINEHFEVIEEFYKFQAIGSGRDIAIGAMYATKDLKIEPSDRVRISVEAARAYNTGVGGIIHTVIV